MAPACVGATGFRTIQAIYRRQGRAVSTPIPRADGYLPNPLGEQDHRQSGYSPACANEWRPGVCEKPRIKCGDCGNRLLIPLSDAIIYGHLAGEHTVGLKRF